MKEPRVKEERTYPPFSEATYVCKAGIPPCDIACKQFSVTRMVPHPEPGGEGRC